MDAVRTESHVYGVRDRGVRGRKGLTLLTWSRREFRQSVNYTQSICKTGHQYAKCLVCLSMVYNPRHLNCILAPHKISTN